MLVNRSMPKCTVIPELAYPDVGKAADWLCAAFGFTVRIRITDHRAQLNVGDGAMVVTELAPGRRIEDTHALMVRVANVDGHHARAVQHGARIVRPPKDYPYGERQYTAEDFAGHIWTFSQSIEDVAPEKWGGTSGLL
jgi:uncharacterized glyoxalase superfamily protein PhnB